MQTAFKLLEFDIAYRKATIIWTKKQTSPNFNLYNLNYNIINEEIKVCPL